MTQSKDPKPYQGLNQSCQLTTAPYSIRFSLNENNSMWQIIGIIWHILNYSLLKDYASFGHNKTLYTLYWFFYQGFASFRDPTHQSNSMEAISLSNYVPQYSCYRFRI